jgi:hypothetical protein
MRKFVLVLAVLFLTALVDAATSFAQSSGSFSASYNGTQCSITATDGTLASIIRDQSLVNHGFC